METYKIIRFYQDQNWEPEVIMTGLTLAQARAHCKSRETSSTTATSPEATARTAERGPWFDGYTSH